MTWQLDISDLDYEDNDYLCMKMKWLEITFVLSVLQGSSSAIKGYNYEEPLLYGTFPEGFLWGTATAAYQVNAFFAIAILEK